MNSGLAPAPVRFGLRMWLMRIDHRTRARSSEGVVYA